jgi:hypothetical protein
LIVIAARAKSRYVHPSPRTIEHYGSPAKANLSLAIFRDRTHFQIERDSFPENADAWILEQRSEKACEPLLWSRLEKPAGDVTKTGRRSRPFQR